MLEQGILIAHDLSPVSSPALDEAIRLARASGAEVIVFHAFPNPPGGAYSPGGPPDAVFAVREAQVEILERMVAYVRSFHVDARLRVTEQDAARAIEEAADDERVALIILGRPARGPEPTRLGRVAGSVVRTSRRPVLVARSGHHSPLQATEDVIVGIDFSAASVEAMLQGEALALLLGSRLHLLHVSAPSGSDAREVEGAKWRLGVLANKLRFPGGSVTSSVTIAADRAKALVAEATRRGQALIVMGPGRVATEVLRTASSSVWVAQAPLDAVSARHRTDVSSSTVQRVDPEARSEIRQRLSVRRRGRALAPELEIDTNTPRGERDPR